MYCPQCGNELDNFEQYCRVCGLARIEIAPQPATSDGSLGDVDPRRVAGEKVLRHGIIFLVAAAVFAVLSIAARAWNLFPDAYAQMFFIALLMIGMLHIGASIISRLILGTKSDQGKKTGPLSSQIMRQQRELSSPPPALHSPASSWKDESISGSSVDDKQTRPFRDNG